MNALAINGFVPKSLLIFKSGSSSGDYHSDINSENVLTSSREKLLLNLPPNSVRAVDNASYHNTTVDKNISSANRKQEMQE